jgi:uncharacterized protein (DUF433 family)
MSTDRELLERITFNPAIFGGKAIIRGRRLAVEHIIGMLAAGATAEEIVHEYGWVELEDVRACLVYAQRVIANEYFDAPTYTTSER